jgi:hypothetical protein
MELILEKEKCRRGRSESWQRLKEKRRHLCFSFSSVKCVSNWSSES